MDWDEARRLSGQDSLAGIDAFFSASGVSLFAITHGAKEFYVRSDGRIFEETPLLAFPVCELVGRELAEFPERRGDTTGCGDNFAGGFVASFVRQLLEGRRSALSVRDAASWAAASGGFACFTLGGTYFEKEPGEKLRALRRYRDAWLDQRASI
jgi:sugar/nucleoside kinase (ribokinase family)